MEAASAVVLPEVVYAWKLQLVVFPDATPYFLRLTLSVVKTSDVDVIFAGLLQRPFLDYISGDRGKGLAILSVRPEGTTDWAQKLYDVSVSSSAPAVLQYTESDVSENGSAPVNYQVLFLAVNSCYIVEKTNRTTPPSVVDRSESTQSK
ncbi:hypothetical protein MTO96_033334, partial [Rhipicephalus appendiculatus]